MNSGIKKIVDSKFFHIGMLVLIVFVVFLIVIFTCLRYQVEGEKNTPFIISKLLIISSSEGIDEPELVDNNRWNFSINQNNDIYIYIEKNDSYGKIDTIKEVLVDKFNMTKVEKNGKLKIYKPDENNVDVIFSNKDINSVDCVKYLIDENSDMKNMKITNQGGIVAFRCANDGIAKYVGNDEEINHNQLLKKSNLSDENLKINLTFDVTIKLDSGKDFKSNIKLELPTENLVQKGTSSREITGLDNFVFKRVKNK